jgi:hypothetical protein
MSVVRVVIYVPILFLCRIIMLRAADLIYEMEQTEAVHFAIVSQPHSPGLGADFFAALGKFNKENTLKLELITHFPSENWVKLTVAGEGAQEPLTRAGVKELLDFFMPYYLNSWSRADLVELLKEEGKWPAAPEPASAAPAQEAQAQ